MRTAQDFVDDYRRKGYPDDRIRIIASMRPEPLRSEVLNLLQGNAEEQTQPAMPPAEIPTVETPAPEKIAMKAPPVEKLGAKTPPAEAPKAKVEPVVKEEPVLAIETTPAKELDVAQTPPAAEEIEQAPAMKQADVAQTPPAAKAASSVSAQAPVDDEAEVSPAEELETARREAAKLYREREKLQAALEKARAEMVETAKLRKERDRLNADAQKMQAELEKARAEGAEAKDLRKRVVEMDALREELERARGKYSEAAAGGQENAKRLTELQASLAEKEQLLAVKDDLVSDLQTALGRERVERESAVTQADELAAQVSEQGARLKELEPIGRQFPKVSAQLEELLGEARLLTADNQEKIERIGELEVETAKAREDGDTLRQQLDAQEQAVEDLQERVTARESELESLRAHFDREASDLKKRAEQEMWLLQRRLGRLKLRSGLGAVVAAGLLVVSLTAYLRANGENRHLRLAAAPSGTNVQPADLRGTSVQHTARAPIPTPTGVADVVPLVHQATPTTTVPARSTAAPAPVPPTPARAATRREKHIVVSGENLSSIARKYLGDKGKWPQIVQENDLPNDRIKPGQILYITVPAE